MTPPAVLLVRPADVPEHVAEVLTAGAEGLVREVVSGQLCVCSPDARVLDEVERIGAPAVIIWPAVARLRGEHVQAALEDLEAGCDVVFGPLVDGGCYLLGFQELVPLVRELLAEDRGSPGDALAGAAQSGFEIGYLRPERALSSSEGVALALADPLTPPEIRQLLGG